MIWLIYALLSAITAAFVAIFAKMGSNLDTLIATFIRSTFMTMLLFIGCLLFKKHNHWSSISSYDLSLLAASGTAGALSWLFYFLALKSGFAFKVVAIDRLSIVFTALLSVLLLGEHLTLINVLGLGFMFIGALLTIY